MGEKIFYAILALTALVIGAAMLEKHTGTATVNVNSGPGYSFLPPFNVWGSTAPSSGGVQPIVGAGPILAGLKE